MSFTATGNGYPTTLPDPGFPFLISAFGTDLEPSFSGPAGVYVQDTSGVFVIEWKNVPHLVDPTSSYTFEILLNSQDSTLLFQYLSAQGVGWNAVPRVIGIQNEDGSSYLEFTSPNFFRPVSDSFAILFYFNPVPDIDGLEILMPNASTLLETGVSFSPKAQFTNRGPTPFSLRFICVLDSLGFPFYSDTTPSFSMNPHDTVTVTFRSWTPQNHTPFRMMVFPWITGDPNPQNDTLKDRYRVPLPWDTMLGYYDGNPANAVSWDQTGFFALRFSLSDSFRLSYIEVGLVSEGDSLWPYPDPSRDPIAVGVWLPGPDGSPEEMMYLDTLWRDTIPPGVVYGVPAEDLEITDSAFFVGVATQLPDHRREGILVDSALDASEAQWMWTPDQGWQHGVWSPNGDPWIQVYGAFGPIFVSESDTFSWDPGVRIRNGTFYFDSPLRIPFQLTIYDISGRQREIFVGSGKEFRVDLAKVLPSGVYFFILESSRMRFQGKFTVLRP